MGRVKTMQPQARATLVAYLQRHAGDSGISHAAGRNEVDGPSLLKHLQPCSPCCCWSGSAWYAGGEYTEAIIDHGLSNASSHALGCCRTYPIGKCRLCRLEQGRPRVRSLLPLLVA